MIGAYRGSGSAAHTPECCWRFDLRLPPMFSSRKLEREPECLAVRFTRQVRHDIIFQISLTC
jgi:hypothetical protein